MCKVLTVAYADKIGERLVGWSVYNGKDYSFLSDKQIKARLAAGELVNGLKLGGGDLGEVVMDKEFTGSLMGKSGLTFSPIMTEDTGDEEPVMNKYYALVKVVKTKTGTEYTFITNRCGLEVFEETQLKAMLGIMSLGGVRLDETGKVVVHPGVVVEGATGDQEKPQGGSKGSKDREGVT